MTTETQTQRPSFDELVQVKHLLTTGLYVKAYHAPAGLRMYTKQFDQDHMTILARGTALLELGGHTAKLVGPAHCDTRSQQGHSEHFGGCGVVLFAPHGPYRPRTTKSVVLTG